MIIEDKFGKILKYTSNSTKAEVISKGDINASSFSEKIYIHDKLNILLTYAIYFIDFMNLILFY